MTHLDRTTLVGFDELGSDERVGVLDHVAVCAACRQAWLADDPARLFALLGNVDVPLAALDRLSERIGRSIDGRRARGRFLGAASLAASLLLGVLVGGYLYQVPRPEALVLPVETGAPLTAGAGEERVEPGPALPLPRWSTDPVRGVELIDSPGTGRLVNLSVGETRVVMIFDEAFDI